jgi:hypothetical protein
MKVALFNHQKGGLNPHDKYAASELERDLTRKIQGLDIQLQHFPEEEIFTEALDQYDRIVWHPSMEIPLNTDKYARIVKETIGSISKQILIVCGGVYKRSEMEKLVGEPENIQYGFSDQIIEFLTA